jgi:hypothetical protein
MVTKLKLKGIDGKMPPGLGYGLEDRWFDPWQGLEIFISPPLPDRLLGPTQPPIQWVPRVLSPGVKRLGREADHSPPSSGRG